MIVLVLAAVVVLAVGGCVCVVWAARGGAPRWVRVVSATTLTAGELARKSGRTSRTNGSSGSDD
ncbi:hypothetical protein ACFVT5_07245 [Streptomyces sp. NPDC058001]|uniref:hypothetical protein n=1 Tax=Streptomyces sp. NPDC058001 TaxID=3346300 RepID=UPI0036F1072C